jgi:hypothetical protein
VSAAAMPVDPETQRLWDELQKYLCLRRLNKALEQTVDLCDVDSAFGDCPNSPRAA